MSCQTGRIFFACLLTACLTCGCTTSLKYTSEEGVCSEVVDGDTLWIEVDNKRVLVRLIGIDAWEIHQNQRLIRQVLSWKKSGHGVSYTEACHWGTNGWRTLQHLLSPGTPVKVHWYGKDVYGRWLGSVFVSHIWVNEYMVSSGWARTYFLSNELSSSEKKRLKEAEKKAQQNHLGMWRKEEFQGSEPSSD